MRPARAGRRHRCPPDGRADQPSRGLRRAACRGQLRRRGARGPLLRRRPLPERAPGRRPPLGRRLLPGAPLPAGRSRKTAPQAAKPAPPARQPSRSMPRPGPGGARARGRPGRADHGAADGPADRGDPSAAGEQHVQRIADPAALRAPAGRTVRVLGRRRRRAGPPAAPPVRGRAVRRGVGVHRAGGPRRRPGTGLPALAGAPVRQVPAAGPLRRHRDARHRAGRRAADDEARRDIRAERADRGPRARLRCHYAVPAGQRGAVPDRRPRAGRGAG